MIKDCKHCGPLSEIAITKHKEDCVYIHEAKCMCCKQTVRRNTREALLLAWNHANAALWDNKTEENFNRIMAGGSDA